MDASIIHGNDDLSIKVGSKYLIDPTSPQVVTHILNMILTIKSLTWTIGAVFKQVRCAALLGEPSQLPSSSRRLTDTTPEATRSYLQSKGLPPDH